MKTLVKIIEFLPVIAFFICYRLSSDLVLATAVIVGGCLLAVLAEYLITRTISRMQIFLTGAILLFGVPTVLLRDPEIIKWKVTVVNLILALAIFITQFVFRKNPFGYLLGQELRLPEGMWLKMSAAWMVFFVAAAALNVVIAFCLPALFGIDPKEAESLWVDYKTFGNAILNFVFAIICLFVLFRQYPEALSDLGKGNDEPSASDRS